LGQRDLIHKDNNGKIGVYAWINNINGKFYIGSGDPLYVRLSDYYQNWYLNSRSSLYIVRALSAPKHGMFNFTLAILEFTDEISIISCEQKYINRFKPEYNLNPLATLLIITTLSLPPCCYSFKINFTFALVFT